MRMPYVVYTLLWYCSKPMKKEVESSTFSHTESRKGFKQACYQPVHTLWFRFRNPPDKSLWH